MQRTRNMFGGERRWIRTDWYWGDCCRQKARWCEDWACGGRYSMHSYYCWHISQHWKSARRLNKVTWWKVKTQNLMQKKFRKSRTFHNKMKLSVHQMGPGSINGTFLVWHLTLKKSHKWENRRSKRESQWWRKLRHRKRTTKNISVKLKSIATSEEVKTESAFDKLFESPAKMKMKKTAN